MAESYDVDMWMDIVNIYNTWALYEQENFKNLYMVC